MQKNMDFADELSRIMECPVCFEYVLPPIYNCEGGHVTCNNCMKHLRKCSICEAPFSKIRNRLLECMMEKCRFQCVNNAYGCNEVIAWKNMESHLSRCIFGPIKCYIQDSVREESCLKSFKPSEYITHLENVHNSFGISSSNMFHGNFHKNGKSNVKTCFLRDPSTNVIYLIHSKLCSSNVCWWVNASIPQNYSQIAEFSFKKGISTFSGRNETEESITWRVPVLSPDRPFLKIRNNGECVELPINHIRSLFPSPSKDEIIWEVSFKLATGIKCSGCGNSEKLL